MREAEIRREFHRLVLPDLTVTSLGTELTLEGGRRVDEVVEIQWEGQSQLFAVEYKSHRSLLQLRNMVTHGMSLSRTAELPTLLVVPYLSREALELMRRSGVSAVDLSGNAYVKAPGQWSFLIRGAPNRFPDYSASKAPYRGRSSLVARVLVDRSKFESIGAVHEEIARRGGEISLSQVSKVLTVLADDLVIEKSRNNVHVIQHEKLLDALAANYVLPKSRESILVKTDGLPDFLSHLRMRAIEIGSRVVGFRPDLYAAAPTTERTSQVYVQSPEHPDIADALNVRPVHAFADVELRVVDTPTVFFDARNHEGFDWCPPLEVYLQFQQMGKRERDIAADIRKSLLSPNTHSPHDNT